MDQQREELVAILMELPPEKLEFMRDFIRLLVGNAGFAAEYDRLFPLDGGAPDFKIVDELVQKWMEKERLGVPA